MSNGMSQIHTESIGYSCIRLIKIKIQLKKVVISLDCSNYPNQLIDRIGKIIFF